MSDPQHWRLETRDGVAVLVLDVPGRSANALTDETFRQLRAHVEAIAADERVVAAVLTSGKPGGFSPGADVERLPRLAAATDADAEAVLREATDALDAVAASRKPFVAAIAGVAYGGGLELALACHARVATDEQRTRFALPEVKLGLLPGAGGTQRLPRLLPLPIALEHLLTGKTMYVARARALGLLDDAVPPNRLLPAATALARALAAGETTPRPPLDAPGTDELDALLMAARQMAAERTMGLWPAPEVILDVVGTGLREGVDAGIAAEREGFLALLRTPEAAAALHLFTATEAAKRHADRAAGEAAKRHADRTAGASARKVFVLGGGMMGAGLGAVLADQRLDVRVRDVDERALARVHAYTDRVLRERYAKRRDAFPALYRERYHHLSTTTDLRGLGTADIVIEAVYEDADLKRDVLADAEARARPDAVLASNTSAIPIGKLAGALRHPERFCGLHFFSPVDRMPLVEVIPHAATSEDTLARALALVRQLDKVPVVVADQPGFFTSRVFGRWLAEGLRLVLEGARIEQVDAAARALGFPVGPLTAYDEVSLTLARKAASDPDVAARADRGLDGAPVRAAVDALVAAGHVGRAGGLGFYRYEDGERRGPAAEVYGVLGVDGEGHDDEEEDLRDRLLFSFVAEAFACLDDGVLRSRDDGDVAAVLGIGFPPNLGGPFHYVERIGAQRARAVLGALDGAHGGFPVAAALSEVRA